MLRHISAANDDYCIKLHTKVDRRIMCSWCSCLVILEIKNIPSFAILRDKWSPLFINELKLVMKLGLILHFHLFILRKYLYRNMSFVLHSLNVFDFVILPLDKLRTSSINDLECFCCLQFAFPPSL